ncbi:MAG: exosortase C-terminal domain/associated protein EpsI [candidate division Zixibacteria bacterium]
MGRLTSWFIIAVLIIAGGGSFSRALRNPQETSGTMVDLESIPLTMDGWSAREIQMGAEIEQLLDVNQYIHREYMHESGFSIWLFVGYFTSQKFGSGIHSPRNCLPGSGWEIANRSYAPLPGDNDLRVNRMDIIRGDSRQVMYYWFVTRAGHLNNEFSLKGDLIISSILGRPTDAAFIRINIPTTGIDRKTTEMKIENFLNIFKKEVYTVLPF